MAQSNNPAPPGRPALANDLKRTAVVQFRVTAEEKERLERAADALGLTLSEYVRIKATGDESPLASPALRPEPPGVYELRRELGSIGNNLNQIARRLNTNGEHIPDQLASAARHLDEIFLRMLDGETIH